MTLQLSQKTITVLKNFASINQSIVFREGNTLSTMNVPQTILGRAPIDETIPCDFGIFDLPRFLNTLSVMESPVLEPSEKSVKITGKRGETARYACAPIDSIISPTKKLKLPTVDVSFTLKNEDFEKLMRAIGVLKFDDILVKGDGKNVTINGNNIKDPTSDVFSIPVGETEATFSLNFKADRFRLLPGDYEVSISSEFISEFSSAAATYWIALEQTSTYRGK